MFFNQRNVRKHIKRSINKVIIPGESNAQKRKTYISSRITIAASLTCIMLTVCTVLVVIALKDNKGNKPDLTDYSNLQKLPAIEKGKPVYFSEKSDSVSKPDIDINKLKTLPVYKFNSVNTDMLLDTILNYFSIDKDNYDLEIRDSKGLLENVHVTLCTIRVSGIRVAEISIVSNGDFNITIENYRENSMNFGLNIPDLNNKDKLNESILSYVNENYSLFQLDAKTVIYDNEIDSLNQTFYARIKDKEPDTDIEKLRYLNMMDEFVSVHYISDRLYIFYNSMRILVGEYPLMSIPQAIEKCQNGDILYGSKYSENDELINATIEYVIVKNQYIRPVYNLTFKSKDGKGYYAVIDPIDEKYTLKQSPTPEVINTPTPTATNKPTADNATEKPIPTPFYIWEKNFNIFKLSYNNKGELRMTNTETGKYCIVDTGWENFTEKIEMFEYDISGDGINEIIFIEDTGRKAFPAYEILVFNNNNGFVTQIPCPRFDAEKTVKATGVPGEYILECKETNWEKTINIADESFYHDEEGNLYKLYMYVTRTESCRLADNMIYLSGYSRIDGYSDRIEGEYTMILSIRNGVMVIEDQQFVTKDERLKQ